MMRFLIGTNHSQKYTKKWDHERCNEERYDLEQLAGKFAAIQGLSYLSSPKQTDKY